MTSPQELFKDAGANLGVMVWRVEHFSPVPFPENLYGSLYDADCYLVLHTKPGQQPGAKEYDIYFWEGDASGDDEKGSVAIFATQLDDLLGGKPVQHRETQGHESPQFVGLFRTGIKLLKGGVGTAFNHVTPETYVPRLFKLKGKKNVRICEINLERNALNEGDVFILDAGMQLFQWNGKKANKYEKFRGLQMINQIKEEERFGHPTVVYLDQDNNDHDPEAEPFWKLMGGRGRIQPETPDEEDPNAKSLSDAILLRVTGHTTDLKTEEVGRGGRFDKNVLANDQAFLLDTGSEVIVWVGHSFPKPDRKELIRLGTRYLAANNRPSWCPVSRVFQEGENTMFKSYFTNWAPKRQLDLAPKPKPVLARGEQKADVSALYDHATREEKLEVEEQAAGKTTIWRVEHLDLEPWPEEKYGHFYSGDAFVVLYEYLRDDREHSIVYFWQGQDSTTDEKAVSAILTVHISDNLMKEGKDPVQVRVVQNKEPNHFYHIFKGLFVVHHGGKASGFRNVRGTDTDTPSPIELYQVHGTSIFNTRAFQVESKCSNLNSGDVFILNVQLSQYLWIGSGSTTEEQTCARNIAKAIKHDRTYMEVAEGKEPEAFWGYLGGKSEYSTVKVLGDMAHPARLFECNGASGRLVVSEIFNFGQNDLAIDEVFLLDTYVDVWVWVGVECTEQEKKDSFQAALDYVNNAPDGRDKDTPVMKVDCGNEPPLFTCHFPGWDPNFFSRDPYTAQLMKAHGVTGRAQSIRVKKVSEVAGYQDWETHKFPYEQLKGHAAGVDPAHKEKYLAPAEFEQLFKCTLETFESFPAWRQRNLKQRLRLF